MTIAQFKAFQKARPFRPYAIHLADGRSVTIPHPEFAILSKSGLTVAVFDREQLSEVIDLLLVTSLRPLAESAALPAT